MTLAVKATGNFEQFILQNNITSMTISRAICKVVSSMGELITLGSRFIMCTVGIGNSSCQ